ncbi:MAG: hypothetical protein JW833_11145 [Prolixibacteraceae bacterium]|nr:hypothetical protein [Prolixibacteraceae bacterium]
MNIIQKLSVWITLFLILTITSGYRNNTENTKQESNLAIVTNCFFTISPDLPVSYLEFNFSGNIVPAQQVTIQSRLKTAVKQALLGQQKLWCRSKPFVYLKTIPFCIHRFESFEKIFPFHYFL